MESLGELERSVMDMLWSNGDALTAADLRESLAPRELALTTVHTVLSRLESKKFVSRDRSARPHRYAATSSREDHVSHVLSAVLNEAPDRRAVLARFLGSVNKDDKVFLRGVLG